MLHWVTNGGTFEVSLDGRIHCSRYRATSFRGQVGIRTESFHHSQCQRKWISKPQGTVGPIITQKRRPQLHLDSRPAPFPHSHGPRPVKSTGRHGHFLNSTGWHDPYRQRHWLKYWSDMGYWHFLNSTGDSGNIKQQRHETLVFLKIDMRHQDPPPPRQGPHSPSTSLL